MSRLMRSRFSWWKGILPVRREADEDAKVDLLLRRGFPSTRQHAEYVRIA